MAVDTVARTGAGTRATLAAPLRDILAGSICSLLSIAFCLSFATLLFSGPLIPWLGYGIAATFLTAAVAAGVVASRSSIPITIAGPDTATSAATAALAAAVAERMVTSGGTEHLLPAVLIVIALGAGLTGLLLWGFGISGAGRAIRFVPYPVIGGFLGATAWLTVAGAVRVITGQRLNLASADALMETTHLEQLAAAAAVGLALFLARRHIRSPLAIPGVLLASVAAVNLAVLITGTPLADAQSAGWMFRPLANVGLMLPWHADELQRFPWSTLPSLSGDLLAVMFVTATSMLLNTTGIELVVRREADLDRDLNALGTANLLSAALGGYASCVSLSRTNLNNAAGATGRLSAFVVAAVMAAMLGLDQGFLGYVPKCVLGGMLLFLGLDLLYRWLIASFQRLSLIEYLSLVAIVVINVQWGFIAGVLLGVVIGCATFAFSVSRVNAIKFSFDGSEYRSSLDRGTEELALLAGHGREIQGLSLQSYLFFGSANRLYQRVKELLIARDCRFLVFDFKLVTGIDSSATHSFTQIKQAAGERGVRLVLVNLTRELEKAFRTIRFITDDIIVAADLDRALENCENLVITAHQAEDSGARTLRAWLAEALGNPEHAGHLAEQCTRLEVAAGETVARQGDAADCMHFILEGRVGVVVDVGAGRSVRVRSLGRHTTIGEMGLITRRPRSATIQAEVASVLYELRADAFEAIKRDHPQLSQALLTYVVSVMAERLSFASRVIGILQR